MIQAVIFDLDQTLVDRTTTFKRFLEKQHQRFAKDLRHVSRDSFVSLALNLDNNGYTPKEILYASLGQHFSFECPSLLEDFKQSYGQEPVLFPEVISTLNILKKTYKLGLITNGRSRGQRAKIAHSGLQSYFTAIKISEEEGIAKPNRIIFSRCLYDLGVIANQAAYVGDHPENDIRAACQAGLKTIWLKNPVYTCSSADVVIENISQITNALQHLQ